MKPLGRDMRSPVPQYVDQSTQGVLRKSRDCWPPRQRALASVTFPLKRASRVSAILRNPFSTLSAQAFNACASSFLGLAVMESESEGSAQKSGAQTKG